MLVFMDFGTEPILERYDINDHVNITTTYVIILSMKRKSLSSIYSKTICVNSGTFLRNLDLDWSGLSLVGLACARGARSKKSNFVFAFPQKLTCGSQGMQSVYHLHGRIYKESSNLPSQRELYKPSYNPPFSRDHRDLLLETITLDWPLIFNKS